MLGQTGHMPRSGVGTVAGELIVCAGASPNCVRWSYRQIVCIGPITRSCALVLPLFGWPEARGDHSGEVLGHLDETCRVPRVAGSPASEVTRLAGEVTVGGADLMGIQRPKGGCQRGQEETRGDAAGGPP
jgi:hypothetical protein